MKKSHSIGATLSGSETIAGFCYLAFQLLLLPDLLTFVNENLKQPLSMAELNFLFYFINFIAVLMIFRRFLTNSLEHIWHHPVPFLEGAILGFVFYYLCSFLITWGMDAFFPDFANYNDATIADMSRSNHFLMFLGTVVLVPPVEECLFRGLIFRNLYPKSRWAAYLVSALAFALIHILGFVGQYTTTELVAAILQYLPAGLCLAWAYTRSDTIFAPILIHAAVNYIGISQMR